MRRLDVAVGERLGDRVRRGNRPCRGREGEEERIALRIHLDATLRCTRFADYAAVLGERICVGLGAELVKEPRRALYVGKEKCDGAGREIRSHAA